MKSNTLRKKYHNIGSCMLFLLSTLSMQCPGPNGSLQPLNNSTHEASASAPSEESEEESEIDEDSKIYDALEQDNIELLPKSISEFAHCGSFYYEVNDSEGLVAEGEGTLLSMAIVRNSKKIVQALLEAGADINAHDERENKNTPLIDAACYGSLEIVNLLVNKGAHIQACDKKGRSALFNAFLYRADKLGPAVAKVLLDAGADLKERDQEGKTILYHVIQSGKSQEAAFLIQAYQERSPKASNEQIIYGLLSQEEVNSLLQNAAQKGYLEILDLLHKEGVCMDVRNQDGDTLLHKVFLNDQFKTTQFLLDVGLSINAENSSGQTLFYCALGKGIADTNLLENLLQLGGNINQKDYQGRVALWYAIMGGSVDTVNWLIQKYQKGLTQTSNEKILYELLGKDQFNNVLLEAVQSLRKDMVVFLLDSGGDIQAKDHEGRTVLHRLFMHEYYMNLSSHKSLLQTLLKAGAAVNTKDRYGKTPLDYATKKIFSEQAEILRSHGAVISHSLTEEAIYQALEKDDVDVLPIHELIERKFSVTIDQHGVKTVVVRNLLHIAVSKGSVKICEAICKSNRNNAKFLNWQDELGYTPLHMAVLYNQPVIVEGLLKFPCDLNILDYCGETPLSLAMDLDDLAIFKSLLDVLMSTAKRRNLAIDDIHSGNGETLLHVAVRKGKANIVELLLEKGANREITDKRGNTALHIAFAENQVEIAKMLLGAGANVHAKNNAGATPLHEAIDGYRADTSALIKLLERGAEVDIKDRYGKSPLYYAIQDGYPPAVEVLLNHGATLIDEMVIVGLGQGHLDVMRLLLKKNKIDITWRHSINNKTLLHYAIESKENPLFVCLMVKMLLSNVKMLSPSLTVVNVESMITRKDSYGYTPLDYAMQKNWTLVVVTLLDKLPSYDLVCSDKIIDFFVHDYNIPQQAIDLILKKQNFCIWRDEQGSTLLHRAVGAGNEKLVQALIDHKKFYINAKNQHGRSPLYSALQPGRESVLNLLLKAGADTQMKDEYGLTIQAAAAKQPASLVKDILLLWDKHPTEEVVINQKENKALHAAIELGLPRLVEHLLEKDLAALHMIDGQKRTPFDCACIHFSLPIMELLLAQGAAVNLQDATKYGLFAGSLSDPNIDFRLKEVLSQPQNETIHKEYESWKDQTCGICLEKKSDRKPCGRCNFMGCWECYKKIIKPVRCPNCRNTRY